MKLSKTCIESSKDLDFTFWEVYKYGGCSKVYLDQDNNKVYKVYRDYQTERKKQYIYNNLLELIQNSYKIDGNEIVLPSTLYLNEEGILETQKMEYIDGICGVNTLREFYNSKKYTLLIMRFIKLIKKYTNKGFVIEDLKLSNIIFDKNFNPKIIDSDFISACEIKDIFSQSIFIREYTEKFNSSLKTDYNLFCLYFCISMLLLTEEEFQIAMNISKWPSVENLKAINYFIQKNNSIPQVFKLELRNLFSGDKDITFSVDVEYDINDYLIRKKI